MPQKNKILLISTSLLTLCIANVSFADDRGDGYRVLYKGCDPNARIKFTYSTFNCYDVEQSLVPDEVVWVLIPWVRNLCVLDKITVTGGDQREGSSNDVHKLSSNNLFTVDDDDENNSFKIITEREQEDTQTTRSKKIKTSRKKNRRQQ